MPKIPIVALAALLLIPSSLQAQQRPAPSPSIGARAGYDTSSDSFLLGGQLRLPLPAVPIELQAVGDVTFLTGLTERQLAVDALWRFTRGFLVGGGPVFRNSIYGEPGDPRETRSGYSLVIGIGGSVQGRGRVTTGIEFRWVFVDEFRPRTLAIQIGFAPFSGRR